MKFLERHSKLIFFLVLAFHLAVYAWYVYPAAILTKTMPEPDDAFAYIHKANAMVHCRPLESCSAYGSIMAESTRADVSPWFKDRYSGRLFCNYSPLQSALLGAFRFISGSWEYSYALIVIFGGLFIAMSYTLLAYGFFGIIPAALFLLFFTSIKYSGAGWQYVVPANLSGALAALAWFFWMQNGRRWIFALLFSALSVLMHPIGLLLSALGFMLLGAEAILEKKIAWKKVAGLTVTLLLTRHLVHLLQVPGQECSFGAHMGVDGPNVVAGIRTMGRWVLQQKGGILAILVAGFFGEAFFSTEKWTKFLALFCGMLGLFVLAFFYVLPGYPADLSIRLMLPFGSLLGGLIASGTILSVFYLAKILFQSKQSKQRVVAAILLFGLLAERVYLLKTGLVGPAGDWYSLRFWRQIVARTPEYFWDAQQFKLLHDRTDATSLIAFDHESTLYYALANGFTDRRISFFSFFQVPPAGIRPDFYVTASPVQPLLLGEGAIEIRAGRFFRDQEITLEMENSRFSRGMVWIEAAGAKRSFELKPRGITKLKVGSLPAGEITLRVSSEDGTALVLTGIQAFPAQELHWPWDRGIELSQGKKRISISSESIICEWNCRFAKEIVVDGGYSLVMRVK